jgi:hypothetical protein
MVSDATVNRTLRSGFFYAYGTSDHFPSKRVEQRCWNNYMQKRNHDEKSKLRCFGVGINIGVTLANDI